MASVSPLSPLLLRLPKTSSRPPQSRPTRWSVRLPAARAPSTPSLTRRQFSRFSSSAQDNGTGAVQGEEKGEETPKADDDDDNEEAAAARLAEELKAAMAMRKAKREEAGGLIGGVGEEIREIEWPTFVRVLGTTGVVMAVIAGSSVALLTVNAVTLMRFGTPTLCWPNLVDYTKY